MSLYLSFVAIALAGVIGLVFSRNARQRILAVGGLSLAAVALLVLLSWAGAYDPVSYRSEFAAYGFAVPEPDEVPAMPEAYSLVLAVGEMDSQREKWFFKDLGEIPAYREEVVQPSLLPDKPPSIERIYKNGIQRTITLSEFSVSLRLGWNDEGTEFLKVEPMKNVSYYLRPFGSYNGVFPAPDDHFAATRLFMSGMISPADGSMFGMPKGRTAFIVVQPAGEFATQSVTVRELFSTLKPLQNPYVNANNVESFEQARRLLIRGLSFPKRENGVIELLGLLPPIAASLLVLIGLGVFMALSRNLPLALVAGLFVALVSLCGVSKSVFESDVRDLCSERGKIYSPVAVVSSPLWADTATEKLLQCARAGGMAKWAEMSVEEYHPAPTRARISACRTSNLMGTDVHNRTVCFVEKNVILVKWSL
ncbi:MAG: hypothetical protein U5N86_03370 [Planctomycetota bacterium]|nr:hypothetical protein [Planctomycetota bacterium]